MNGRVYDPLVGRFMSADPFIQAPYELQSHNRYAYVMNNPLFYTDPSGYFSWSRFRDSVVKPVVVIAAVVYTGGAIIGAYEGAAAAAILNGGTAWTIGGLGVSGTSAVLAGAGAGFAAGFTGSVLYGANVGDAVKNGARSAVVGGITGGVMDYVGSATNGMNVAARIGAKGMTAGAIASAQGGNFRQAVKRTILTGTAAEMYTRFVGYEADPKLGENAKPYDPEVGGEQYQNTYDPNQSDGRISLADKNRNMFGKNDPLNGDDFMKQGGVLSRAMNAIPGMNALAQFHDTIFNTNFMKLSFDTWNFPTMLPAAVITYGAVIDRMPMLDRSRCPACFR